MSKQPKSLARAEPKRGEVWEHVDGGSIYVCQNHNAYVVIQRRPFGDSQAVERFITLKTFQKLTTGRLRVANVESFGECGR